jgi:hypothetical protein
MRLAIGLLIFVAGIAALLQARPKNGTPRSFVGTSWEVPVVLSILAAITLGVVLSVGGIVGLRS